MIRRSLFLALLALPLVAAASAQMVDISLDYVVPAQWTQSLKPNINITSPDGMSTIVLTLSADHRTADDAMGDTVMRLQHSKKFISQVDFHIADQAGVRMEFEGKMSRKAEVYSYGIICVKRQDAHSTILEAAPLATYEKYRAGIDKVINSVRVVIGDEKPVPTAAPTTAAMPAVPPTAPLAEYSSAELGMKTTLQPGWKLKSEAPGQYSGTPKSTFVPESGTAMVALTTSDNSMQHKDHVKDVLHNIRAQSKSLEKLSENETTLAGMPATRLDLITETSAGSKLRRVVCIVSLGGRQFVAAATALDTEYEQFAGVMQKMLESVQLMSR